MDANKPKNYGNNVSVLDQFNATGVPTGTPESSQQHHHMFSKDHAINNATSIEHRYHPISHPPSTSSSYDFPNFDHKISHGQSESVPVPAWSCTICHKPYKTIAGLDRHIRSQHSAPSVSHNSYENPSKSNNESPSVDRNKSCICTVCGNGFPYQSKLLQHMRVHTGEKPYRCEYENCGKGFCRKDKLTRHMFIHTGERPFPCTKCDKKFYRKDKLTRHERVHMDNKPGKHKSAEIKSEVPPTTVTQTPTTTLASSQYGDVSSMNRNAASKSSRNAPPPASAPPPPPPAQMMPPHEFIVCRFCGAQFSDRPTFDHHLLLHATLLGSKMPEPVKFYSGVPNA